MQINEGIELWMKNQNAWRKEKLKYLGDFGSGQHQTSGGLGFKRKKKENCALYKLESFSKPSSAPESRQRDKHQSSLTCKIFGSLFKLDKGSLQRKGPEYNKVD